MGKKLYIISGEPSGDLHGSNMIESLLNRQVDLDIRFWGGDKMKALVGEPVKHIKDLAFMGFWEVIKNLRTILGNISFCKRDIMEFGPDALILIDYPGFNLRIAKWAKQKRIPVYYYISPSVWAWKENRVKNIESDVKELFCILPFEKDFYKKHNINVTYVGHPLLDEVEKFRSEVQDKDEFYKRNDLNQAPIIAILPGSRKQEVSVKLPIMLKACVGMDEYQLVIAGAPTLEPEFYAEFLGDTNAKIIYNQTYDLLNNSIAAVVTSGTATLETALFRVPQVVCYIGNPISYQIIKRLIKIKYISLVNLIMDEKIVTELIQHECTTANIHKELKEILPNGNQRERITLKYDELIDKLGEGGASNLVAAGILDSLN